MTIAATRFSVFWRHTVAKRLRRYATSRKVLGSRPDEVIKFYQYA
jgi:hypothetical protein